MILKAFHKMDSEADTEGTYSPAHNDTNEDYGNEEEYDVFADMPDVLKRYAAFHYSIHGYLTLVIIIVGTIGNIITMIVLTRKSMISSIHVILSALAFADMMVLLCYLVKVKFHTDLPFMSYTEVTYSLAVFTMFVSHFFITFHLTSVWLMIVAGIWRVGVCYTESTKRFRSISRAKIAVLSTYLVSVLLCIPEYLHYKIDIIKDEDGRETYKIGDSAIYLANRELFDGIDDWGFNFVLYLIPCIPLTCLTIALIRHIYRVKKVIASTSDKWDSSSGDRLTVVLIIILVFFLFVKIPPGIMYVLDFGLGYTIVHQVHFVFAGTINTLILLNSTINFFVYFSASAEFRSVAYTLLCKKIVDKAQIMRPNQVSENDIELIDY